MSNNRQRILNIAAKSMGKKGYKATSIDEIASRVGIHKSTFFHYFKTKEELLLEILKFGIEDVTRNLKSILKDKNLSPNEKLRRAITKHLEISIKYINNVNVYHSEIQFLSNKNRVKYIEARRYYAENFEQIVKEIKEADPRYFKGLDTKIVTFGILGMCNWTLKWYKKSRTYTAIDIANIFYRMIIQEGNSEHEL